MATPKEHIEEIRRTKFSIGGELNPLTEDLHQAVRISLLSFTLRMFISSWSSFSSVVRKRRKMKRMELLCILFSSCGFCFLEVTDWRLYFQNSSEWRGVFPYIFFLSLNAEDNEYGEGVNPSLELVITSQDITDTGAPATLLIFNNEKGFSAKNIESICSVGGPPRKATGSRVILERKVPPFLDSFTHIFPFLWCKFEKETEERLPLYTKL
ncbi:hypothetical protein CK203_068787 [Vitis vinifera]|uniref:Uncharacterized protein n=1 Tax=Vitis vinifera TaxID=29760 RepID=A0A438EY09_VITVI|nr:hypothetical protein CK203_068787 [Vitis vinifera]